MVAQNPLFAGWSLKKFKATVVNDIWPEVLFFSGVATSESSMQMSSLPQNLTWVGAPASGDSCLPVYAAQASIL